MLPIREIISRITQSQHDWKLDFLSKWPTIIGNLHAKVSIEKIVDKTLYVGVVNSCLMQELYILSPILLQSIEKAIGSGKIAHLKFIKVSSFKRKSSLNKKIEICDSPEEVQLSSLEKKGLERICDPGLRQALATYRNRCSRKS